MSTLSQYSGGIKSIQRGTISMTSGGSTSGTATITSVDTTKTELRLLGASNDSVADTTAISRVVLTNATTVTATRSSSSGTTVVSWELTEFY